MGNCLETGQHHLPRPKGRPRIHQPRPAAALPDLVGVAQRWQAHPPTHRARCRSHRVWRNTSHSPQGIALEVEGVQTGMGGLASRRQPDWTRPFPTRRALESGVARLVGGALVWPWCGRYACRHGKCLRTSWIEVGRRTPTQVTHATLDVGHFHRSHRDDSVARPLACLAEILRA